MDVSRGKRLSWASSSPPGWVGVGPVTYVIGWDGALQGPVPLF